MTAPDAISPLSAATDDELLDEWARRWKGVVVLVCGSVPNENGVEQKQIWWRNGYAQALGLVVWASRALPDLPGKKPVEHDEDRTS
jgi:hypothetical protein